jgi:hypothetical protein
MEGAIKSDEGRSRRDVLRALGAAAAGAVAGGVLKAEQAEASHGVINAFSDSDKPAIHAENSSGLGPAIEATADYGTGVVVRAGSYGAVIRSFDETAVDAFSENGRAVSAEAIETSAIFGHSTQYAGVEGSGEDGVIGRATEEIGIPGDGVQGSALNGNGVRGTSLAGVGVKAEAGGDSATALHVDGEAKFSTAAAGTILGGQDSAFVRNPVVTALSHITITLTGDPGQASSAPGLKPVTVWVDRQPGTGFVVHMSRPVRFATPFTYLVVEPV